ncbi:hypothetical protein HPB51_010607 [Rhipicephalus microplus]|uniref:Uncharacterized protein n=1 Tax=Rhipicephalus microplus TaxID=6941 RepID=A0A9J6ENV9_RHIMP|nr:hypothetical protein HPB51_010607 [Rhipicephalus microplus]
MFVIRAVMEKLVQLRQPPVKNTFHDPDEDEDSANLGIVALAERNWLFAPWVCDTMDLVRPRPTGKPTDFTPSRKRKTRSEDVDASIKDLLGSCSTSIQAIAKKKEALQPDECDKAGSLVAVKLKALPKRKRSQVLFEIHKLLHEAEMECLEDSD